MNRYEKVIHKKVFNFEDICELTGNVNTAKSLIKAELEKKHIQKIQHNLYVVCDLQSQKPIGTPYQIGSKITKDSFISYRSALEYYAKIQSTSRIICVSSKRKFEGFRFKGYSYKYFSNKGDFGISNTKGIRITDKERTVLDCIDKPELAGGDEKLVHHLELVGKLNGNKILKYLPNYNSKKLYTKVGFMLGWLNYAFKVEQDVIDYCRGRRARTNYYFNENSKNNVLISKWGLRISKEILAGDEEQYW